MDKVHFTNTLLFSIINNTRNSDDDMVITVMRALSNVDGAGNNDDEIIITGTVMRTATGTAAFCGLPQVTQWISGTLWGQLCFVSFSDRDKAKEYWNAYHTRDSSHIVGTGPLFFLFSSGPNHHHTGCLLISSMVRQLQCSYNTAHCDTVQCNKFVSNWSLFISNVVHQLQCSYNITAIQYSVIQCSAKKSYQTDAYSFPI